MKRIRAIMEGDGGNAVSSKVRRGNYLVETLEDIEFFSTGSKLLDLAMGGGWAERRVANIVGDKSTGKTLLCIEASANFVHKYPKSKVRYREAESAFLPSYAGTLGMPLSSVDLKVKLRTIEDWFDDLTDVCKKAKVPELYIIDSLDSLSDRKELLRDMDEGSYGTGKAKLTSELFRRMIQTIEESKVTVLIVSQVRDKIGAMFGRKFTRSGGRALDFYATHILILSHLGLKTRTIRGLDRTYGVTIKALVDKNKISIPHRDAIFNILYGYGIDDTLACLQWLKKIKALRDVGVSEDKIVSTAWKINETRDKEFIEDIHDAVERRWHEIETTWLPKHAKYGE